MNVFVQTIIMESILLALILLEYKSQVSFHSTTSNSSSLSLFSIVLEINVLAEPSTEVGLGYNVKLTCNVIRSNPDPLNYTYMWTHLNTSAILPVTSNTLILNTIDTDDFGAYLCAVTNGVVGDMESITLTLAVGGKWSQHDC